VTGDSTYLHGARPEEQARLSLLNDLLNEQAVAKLALQPGQFVLDVGCGTALLARRMAEEVGEEGRVVGVERDAGQIATAGKLAEDDPARVEIRQGDALALPLRDQEWGSFDVVHARFLLEHLRDPEAAVRQMLAAARRGGRVVLTDDDHETFRLYPEPPGFSTLWKAYVRVFDRLGNDPYVGRRLVSLLHSAGAVKLRNSALFFGSCAGSPGFESFWKNLVGVVETGKEAIVAGSVLTAEEFDAAGDAIRTWAARPDAAGWYSVEWAEGRRPE
jgi:SAM-dependent methyltransferase